LGPETSIAAQHKIGADLIVAFDELPRYGLPPAKLEQSFQRTHRWMERSLKYHMAHPEAHAQQGLYGIVHGEVNPELRLKSLAFLTDRPFQGIAIGGSLGKDRVEMATVLDVVAPQLPVDRPVHLLGIGDLSSILAAIKCGIDSFDSSYPTKAARHGTLLLNPPIDDILACANSLNSSSTNRFRWSIQATRSKFAKKDENRWDEGPIDRNCTCPVCQRYSRAYIHHLMVMHEPAGLTLASIHNLAVMKKTMDTVRDLILDNAL
jgi:queuine tRNA-ribosyltransferase